MTTLEQLLDRGIPERIARQIVAVDEAQASGDRLPDAAPDIPGEPKPRRLTGQQMLDAMTPAEQDAQFGPEKAAALRAGEIELADLVADAEQAIAPDFITEKPLKDALKQQTQEVE